MAQFVHTGHVQALDGQHGVLADQQAAQLVVGVLPQAGYPAVDGGYAALASRQPREPGVRLADALCHRRSWRRCFWRALGFS